MEELIQQSIKTFYVTNANAYRAYYWLKSIMDKSRRGAYQIKRLKDGHDARVSYLPQKTLNMLSDDNRNELHSNGWHAYANDFFLCRDILKLYGGLEND
jgi:hypothetical protein